MSDNEKMESMDDYLDELEKSFHRLKNGDIALVINTSDTKSSVDDGKKIRQNVLRFKIPYFTTIRAALAAAKSLSTVQTGKALEVKSLQEYLNER